MESVKKECGAFDITARVANMEDELDDIAKKELKSFDYAVYLVRNTMDNISTLEPMEMDPAFADLQINAQIFKNAFDNKKAQRLAEHMRSGKLFVNPETKTMILVQSATAQMIEKYRADLVQMLESETLERKYGKENVYTREKTEAERIMNEDS